MQDFIFDFVQVKVYILYFLRYRDVSGSQINF